MRAVLENPFFGALGSYESTFGEQISTIRDGFSSDRESIVTNPGLFEAIERLLLLTRDYGDQQFASLSILTDVSVLLVIGLFIMLFLLNSQNQRVAIQLTKTLREKEFLIKEVHHRVKKQSQHGKRAYITQGPGPWGYRFAIGYRIPCGGDQPAS
jgi:hypothetical protein